MRGSVTKRGKSWQARVDLGTDPVSGKRRQSSKTFRTRKEAEIELSRWLREIDTGTAIDGTRMTFGDFLDHWLDVDVQHRVRPSTISSYRAQIRAHILPVLGSVPLQKLQPIQIRQFYAGKLIGGRVDGTPGGLSAKSVQYLHGIVHQALAQAIKWQMVPRDVTDAVTPPRSRRRKVTTWTADDARRFLDAEGDDYGSLRLLALGPRWQDVDLERRRLMIRQTLVEIGGVPTIQEPKTPRADGRSPSRKASWRRCAPTAPRSGWPSDRHGPTTTS
jgi:integrase